MEKCRKELVDSCKENNNTLGLDLMRRKAVERQADFEKQIACLQKQIDNLREGIAERQELIDYIDGKTEEQ